jgi:hypothetical protein
MSGIVNWKQVVTDAQLKGGIHPKPGKFGPPAAKAELESLQTAFGNRVPKDLIEFLSQANGSFEPGGGCFIMSVKSILSVKQQCQDLRNGFPETVRSFDDVLFFGDVGTGDYFGYDLSDSAHPIIGWIAIGDERSFKAKNLKELIEGWYSGKIGG